MLKKKCEVCGKGFTLKFASNKHKTCGRKCGQVLQRKTCQEWWDRNKASFSAKQKERLGKKISTK